MKEFQRNLNTIVILNRHTDLGSNSNLLIFKVIVTNNLGNSVIV